MPARPNRASPSTIVISVAPRLWVGPATRPILSPDPDRAAGRGLAERSRRVSTGGARRGPRVPSTGPGKGEGVGRHGIGINTSAGGPWSSRHRSSGAEDAVRNAVRNHFDSAVAVKARRLPGRASCRRGGYYWIPRTFPRHARLPAASQQRSVAGRPGLPCVRSPRRPTG